MDDTINGINDNINKISYIPFYGGAKGQYLKIVESKDGTVVTEIIKSEEVPKTEPITETLEIMEPVESGVNKEIRSIHETAQNIIKLQATAKKNGQLSEQEEKIYNENLEQLNLAAKNLANFQQMQADEDAGNEDVSRANLQFWFEQKKSKFWGKGSEENKEENENTNNENEETEDDGVAINLPPDDASVAEAKPVGLAVAGIGGVAASKPIATAVVGPNGLAVARPVATAIAGVPPEDASIPIFADGYIKFPEKKKDKIPNMESQNNKEICKDKPADKCDNKGNKTKEEKPKLDYLSHYRDLISY